ncbi:DNA/RNA non-specific endonuclease [Dyadobacter sediminis]|uniref:DNA/RNA non-specific endonuclease n=2 Tax=Dyadobacter sediminis TaxID=1493691 RepID=A0A5R9KL63_9BACT|nr:DNA/RNA non-specific endonuclease [Dyadobacter sediminis]
MLTIPLTISIKVSYSSEAEKTITVNQLMPATEVTRPISYYENYTGYNADFLDFKVPLPTLTEEQRNNAAMNSYAKDGEDPSVLPYTNFSIVMNRQRQLAYYTVVNINGESAVELARGGDKWYLDARIADSEQIGEELYKRNALDRGHLVRRLDPVWGANAARANEDTFHFTNCSPQHERFNQNEETWLGLENYILHFANRESKKLTVFTGPILNSADPLYKGVRLPLAFWKIVVFTRKSGNLGAAAFVLEQGKLIETLPAVKAMFEPGTYRVTIDNLMERTNLDFAYLKTYETPLSENQLKRSASEQVAVKPDYSNVIL